MKSLRDLVDSLAERGETNALVVMAKDTLERWTYGRLWGRVEGLAAGLAEAGVEKGMRGAILAPNSPEWIITALALLRLGAVAVPVDAQMSDESLLHVLRDSEARWLFTTAVLADHLEKRDLGRRPRVVLLDADREGHRSVWRYLAGPSPGRSPMTPDDPAVLFYTSGTTGAPKGVPLTHRNIAASVAGALAFNLAQDDDRIMLPLPLHHVYPFVIGMLAALAAGAALVLPFSLTGPQILRALQEGQVTVIVGVPRLYAALVAAIEAQFRRRGRVAGAAFRTALWLSMVSERLGMRPGRRLFAPLHRRFAPHLRILASGGAALDVPLARALTGLGWEVATGYGLTETSPLLTLNAPGKGRLATAGRPLPGVEIRIDEARPGFEHGEVLARGANVFAGYHNLPEKSREAFTADGYFRTGDLGYLDGSGFLHLTGRASSLIVLSGGENVQPDDVEDVLAEGPHIREAGVLAHENRLVAVVVPEPRAVREAEGGDLERIVREDVERQNRRLATHHRIADYAISHDPLPRTRLGKIQRHKLEERYAEAKRRAGGEPEEKGPVSIERMTPEDQHLLENPTALEVWTWLAEQFPGARLRPETHLGLDLGVDSMRWLNLTLEIQERVGVTLDEAVIAEVETVRDLLRQTAEVARAGGRARGDTIEQLREPEHLLDENQRRWLEPPGPSMRRLGQALFQLNRMGMRALFRLRAEGLDRLPGQGPFVLVANHPSYLDPPAIAAALPREQLAETNWAAWTGIMFRNRLMRLGSRAMQVLPIDPRRSPLASLAFGAAALQRGRLLVWFPEGQRSLTGEPEKFEPGIGLIIAAWPVPVVPAWLEGTHQALPRGRWLPRRHPVRIIFGEPIPVDQLLGAAGHDPIPERIADILRDHVVRLAPKGSAGSPSEVSA